MLPTESTTGSVKSAADAVDRAGQVFVQGGTDGLILYALILATFLMFLALVITAVLSTRERTKAHTECTDQAKAFAQAAKETAEAIRDMATAVASAASADIAIKQLITSKLDRIDVILSRFDPDSSK